MSIQFFFLGVILYADDIVETGRKSRSWIKLVYSTV